jgi:Zn-dependent protease with chaperone function
MTVKRAGAWPVLVMRCVMPAGMYSTSPLFRVRTTMPLPLDGQGKIVVGQQAIELFDAFSLKGFLGHEMAHLVSDSVAEGCNE